MRALAATGRRAALAEVGDVARRGHGPERRHLPREVLRRAGGDELRRPLLDARAFEVGQRLRPERLQGVDRDW
jgi:hypothetical protein